MHSYIRYIMHAMHTRIQHILRAWYTCTQCPCLPIITVFSTVAFSSGGQIKHKLWRELLLQLKNTLFQLRLFNTPPTPSPSGCGSCDGRTETGWGRASNGPAKPTRVRSLSLSFIQPAQALNHFPLHYKKTFVFLHHHPRPHLPPLKTVAGFNHLNERMFASGEVSAVMSLNSTHAHTHIHCQTHVRSTSGLPKIHPWQKHTERKKLRLTATLINTDAECLLLTDISNSGPVI